MKMALLRAEKQYRFCCSRELFCVKYTVRYGLSVFFANEMASDNNDAVKTPNYRGVAQLG